MFHSKEHTIDILKYTEKWKLNLNILHNWKSPASEKDNYWSGSITGFASLLLIFMFYLQICLDQTFEILWVLAERTNQGKLSFKQLGTSTARNMWGMIFLFQSQALQVQYKLFAIDGIILYPLACLILATVWRRGIRLVMYVYLFGKAFTLYMYWEINPLKLKSLAYLTSFLADLFRYLFCLTELSTNFVSGVRSANFAPSSCSYFPFSECLCILDQTLYFPSGSK